MPRALLVPARCARLVQGSRTGRGPAKLQDRVPVGINGLMSFLSVQLRIEHVRVCGTIRCMRPGSRKQRLGAGIARRPSGSGFENMHPSTHNLASSRVRCCPWGIWRVGALSLERESLIKLDLCSHQIEASTWSWRPAGSRYTCDRTCMNPAAHRSKPHRPSRTQRA